MVSDVLLLSYLDKIGLSLTDEAGQAWRIYIVKRGYIREPVLRHYFCRDVSPGHGTDYVHYFTI